MYEKILVSQYVPPMGTSLPSSPSDGDMFVLVDSLSAPTYSWLLRYVAAKSSNKWVFIGGAPGYAYVDAGETCSTTAFSDLATVGPSFTIPVAGTYIYDMVAQAGGDSSSAQFQLGLKVGTAAVDDRDTALSYVSSGISEYFTLSRFREITPAASDVLKVQYKVSAGSVTFFRRCLRVIPVAVGG